MASYKSPHMVKTCGFTSQSRKLIVNVLHFIKTSKKQPELLDGTPTDVAARALNISKNTFTNISKTGLTSPKKRPGRTPKLYFDEFDKISIANIIKEFYRNK